MPTGAQADSAAAEFDVLATGEMVGVYLARGTYVVKAYGTIHYDTTEFGPSSADPECTSPDSHLTLDSIAYHYNLTPSPISGWQSHRYVTQGAPTDLLDLEVDTIAPEWMPTTPTAVAYDPRVGGPGVDAGCNELDHTYEYMLTSVGDNHTFRVFDPAAADNEGSIHVVITQVS
jgi:hypothetical protein